MTTERKELIERLLEDAQEAQSAYWEALRALEVEVGVDLDDAGDLTNYDDAEALLEAFAEDEETK